jgi:hypothetical protein
MIFLELRQITRHTPRPLCGCLLIQALQGCGVTQYDCAFGQNLCIVIVCSFIACPYFRCKLRGKYGVQVVA